MKSMEFDPVVRQWSQIMPCLRFYDRVLLSMIRPIGYTTSLISRGKGTVRTTLIVQDHFDTEIDMNRAMKQKFHEVKG